jgi:hypothetical protein
MIVPFSRNGLQQLSINFRAIMLMAEVYPSALPLLLHILAVNIKVPERTVKVGVLSLLCLILPDFSFDFVLQVFMYHLLDQNPQHITTSLLKEYLTVLPLMAVEAAASKLLCGRLPWSDLICLPFTRLIHPPSADDVTLFEQKMSKRCGLDFNRKLALAFPMTGKMSKRDIHCECR